MFETIKPLQLQIKKGVIKILIRPFHIAFPVPRLDHIKSFYGNILGCTFGREDKTWIDINFFNHQLVFHQSEGYKLNNIKNDVDAHAVPVPHFGVILTLNEWKALAQRLKEHQIECVIEPYIRFEGQPGEQATMFFYDPVGYALEFKAFADDSMIFST